MIVELQLADGRFTVVRDARSLGVFNPYPETSRIFVNDRGVVWINPLLVVAAILRDGPCDLIEYKE